MIKIGLLTAKIFLVWTNVVRTNVVRTNVVRTNVAWTNVTGTVGICLRWSQEATFQVWSKLGQKQLRLELFRVGWGGVGWGVGKHVFIMLSEFN